MKQDVSATFIGLAASRAGLAKARNNHCPDQIDTAQRMKTAIACCLVLMCWASAALSQTVTVKATVQTQSERDVVLRLDSGGAVVVPLADVLDVAAPGASAAPHDASATRESDAYRVVRCEELREFPSLVPPETLARDLRELECDSLAAAPPASQAPSAVPTYDVRQQCATRSPTDVQMRAFCEKQQQAALASLRRRVMTSSDRQTIRRRCLGEFPQNYQIQNFCEEQQIKALVELGRER
jgi:hypothetical protein